MPVFRHVIAVVLFALVLGGGRAAHAECWQGWGYIVDPRNLAFKSGQQLYVTEGPVNWLARDWVKLFILDPATGRRQADVPPIRVRPNNPNVVGGGAWPRIVEDVAEVWGSTDGMMLRLSHVPPAPSPAARGQDFARWACGLEP